MAYTTCGANVYFVDPAGDDSGPGTLDHPFATLERARSAASPGTVITLRAGTHRLTRTLHLNAADSGVTYQAHGYGTPEQEEVVISGGRTITGWTLDDKGVRSAHVPGLATRQLYVGGRRVERARAAVEHTLSRTPTGYRSTHPHARTWSGEPEFVYQGAYPWAEGRCPVQRVEHHGDTTTLTMAHPAFERATRLYRSVVPWQEGENVAVEHPTHVENSPDLLTEGTFALDHATLYHLPHAEDRLDQNAAPGPEAEEVVAPALETLVHAKSAHDLAFLGITFADATWLRPSAPEGFLHYHGNGHHDGGELYTVEFTEGGYVTVPADATAMPANVFFEDCSRVLLEGCRLTRLGAVALELRGGVDNVLRHSHVHDVSGGGVVVTGGARTRIEDNHVHGVGHDYRGSPALLLSDTRRVVVAHNRIGQVPHAGIVLYQSRGARLVGNLVHDTMLVLADGGGIYISGPQGEGEEDRAVVAHNVVRDTLTPYNFGLYTDYGAAWLTVRGNVVHRADAPVVLRVWPPLQNVSFVDNHWDADPGPAPEGVVLSGNRVLSEADPATDPRVVAIIAQAGPRPQRPGSD